MTQYPVIFKDLAAPFAAEEVKQRQGTGGKKFDYVTARSMMNRLDETLGPENWWDKYIPGERAVICELSIRLPDGSIITKCDAGGFAGMADSGDDEKSGFSDAFKRANFKFGVGRYLYRDGVPNFDTYQERPADAQSPAPAASAQPPPQQQAVDYPTFKGDGKALYNWIAEKETALDTSLMPRVKAWCESEGVDAKIVRFTEGTINRCYAMLLKHIAALQAEKEHDAREANGSAQPAKQQVDVEKSLKLLKEDPEYKTKFSIRQGAIDLFKATGGQGKDPAKYCEIIAAAAEGNPYGFSGPVNLREFKDRLVLNYIDDVLFKKVQEAEAMAT